MIVIGKAFKSFVLVGFFLLINDCWSLDSIMKCFEIRITKKNSVSEIIDKKDTLSTNDTLLKGESAKSLSENSIEPDFLFVACRSGGVFSNTGAQETWAETIPKLSKTVCAGVAMREKSILAQKLYVMCQMLASSDETALAAELKKIITSVCSGAKKVYLVICLIGSCAPVLCHAIKKRGFMGDQQDVLQNISGGTIIFIDPTVPLEDDVCSLRRTFPMFGRFYNFYTKAFVAWYRKIKGGMAFFQSSKKSKKMSAFSGVSNVKVIDNLETPADGERVDLNKASAKLFQSFGRIINTINNNYHINNDLCAKVFSVLSGLTVFVCINRPVEVKKISDSGVSLVNENEGWLWDLFSNNPWNIKKDLKKEVQFSDTVVKEEESFSKNFFK